MQRIIIQKNYGTGLNAMFMYILLANRLNAIKPRLGGRRGCSFTNRRMNKYTNVKFLCIKNALSLGLHRVLTEIHHHITTTNIKADCVSVVVACGTHEGVELLGPKTATEGKPFKSELRLLYIEAGPRSEVAIHMATIRCANIIAIGSL